MKNYEKIFRRAHHTMSNQRKSETNRSGKQVKMASKLALVASVFIRGLESQSFLGAAGSVYLILLDWKCLCGPHTPSYSV